jgi:hypothetical protein
MIQINRSKGVRAGVVYFVSNRRFECVTNDVASQYGLGTAEHSRAGPQHTRIELTRRSTESTRRKRGLVGEVKEDEGIAAG